MNRRRDDVDDDDDDDTRLLVQKAWCHGQSIAPPLLGGVVLFSSSTPSWFESAMILTIVVSWPVVSWRSMRHPSPSSLRRILIGGAVLLSMYAYLLGTMALHSRDTSAAGVRILLMVFTSLMIVETMAYLAVVWYHRTWFERGSVRRTVEGEALQA